MHRYLRLSALLLGSSLGNPIRAQAPLPPGTFTAGILDQFCSSQSTSVCTLPLAGQYTLALRGDWKLPENMHLRFAPGSVLHVTGGVLHFAGGSVEAPAEEHIFPEPDHIRELSATRPEWFADTGQEPVPAGALAAAYAATEPWGTIYLQARKYLSPFHGCPGSDLRYLSPRTFVGAGRPSPDNPANPNALQGGTVLLGGFVGTAPLRLASLGIDVGPSVSTQILQGCKPPAVFIEQPERKFVSGDRLLDISVLTTGAFNMHSVMIAGHQNTEVRDLWIWTLGGTHGLVMKSSQSVVDGLHCRGAVSDCLIVKSDYATDFLGRAVEDHVSHVDIQPLLPGKPVGGIMVDSRWDVVRSLDMQDISESGTTFGIILLGSTFFRPHDISIRHWNAKDVKKDCLYAFRADALLLSDVHCELEPAAQTGLVLHGSRSVTVQNVTLRCDGDPAQCAASHTDGILENPAIASHSDFKSIAGYGLGGYLLRSTRRWTRLGEFKAAGMAGRVYAPYRVTLRDRLQETLAQTKPNLRIAYTAVSTRVLGKPKLYGVLGILLLGMVLLEHKRPIRWPVNRKRFRLR